jgi:hypothetical protein
MNKTFISIQLTSTLMSICIAVTGCVIIQKGNPIPLAKYERTVQLSEPMTMNSLFSAKSYDGRITVTGEDTTDCSVTATIVARAGSEAKAKQIAEKTNLSLERTSNRLTVNVEKPLPLWINQCVDVNFDVKLPINSNLELNTTDGDITVENINGIVDVKTGDGKIELLQAGPKIKARSFDGTVRVRENTGDVDIKTFDGKINVTYSEDASGICNISLITNDGTIDLNTPADFSANAEISTNDGSIQSDLPIQITGKLSRKKIKGIIGTGQGNLYIKSGDGTIRIK